MPGSGFQHSASLWDAADSIFKVAELGMKRYSFVNRLSVHVEGELP